MVGERRQPELAASLHGEGRRPLPVISAQVSGTALAASLLRDGWSVSLPCQVAPWDRLQGMGS